MYCYLYYAYQILERWVANMKIKSGLYFQGMTFQQKSPPKVAKTSR